MAKKPIKDVKAAFNAIAGQMKTGASVSSSSSSISNSGEMSVHTSSTGATGAVHNVTNIVSQPGDPGYALGQDSEVIRKHRQMMGL